MRAGLRALISTIDGLVLVGEASSGNEAMTILAAGAAERVLRAFTTNRQPPAPFPTLTDRGARRAGLGTDR